MVQVAGNEDGPIQNRVLASLDQKTFDRLKPYLQLVELVRGQTIDEIDGPIEDMYFVDRGLVSIVKTMSDGRVVEVGAAGTEGVTDAIALFGIDRAVLETIVQVPGRAYRIKRIVLMQEMERDAILRTMLRDYARFAIGQLARTAACNRLHALEGRSCRWLLIAHDNAGADSFELTQEFLAMMLGVQRSGVSIVANMLKRAELISYSHGRVTIIDRRGIENAACECYAEARRELERIFRQGSSEH